MKTYKVPNFVLYKLIEPKLVVQTEYSTVIIENENIFEFFMSIEESGIFKYNERDLELIFEDESTEIIKFLIENRLLFETNYIDLKYEKILIASSDEIIIELLDKLIREKSILPISILNLNKKFNDLPVNLDNTITVCFLNELDNRFFNGFISLIDQSESSALLLSHVYNSDIIFHCLYSSEQMTPCPKCTKGIITGQIYESEGGITYQQLLKMIYEVDDSYMSTYPLSYKNKLLISNQIESQLSYHITDDKNLIQTHSEDFTNIFRLSLATNSIIKDTAIYWELCDCYERNR